MLFYNVFIRKIRNNIVKLLKLYVVAADRFLLLRPHLPSSSHHRHRRDSVEIIQNYFTIKHRVIMNYAMRKKYIYIT